MDVTGQNIANVNTEGYSRQRVELQSLGGTAVPAIWLGQQPGRRGRRRRHRHPDPGRLPRGARADRRRPPRQPHRRRRHLRPGGARLPGAGQHRHPGDALDLWDGLGDIARTPPTPGPRAGARALADPGRRHALDAGPLDRQWGSNDGPQTLVQDVNATASSIADLNENDPPRHRVGLPSNELPTRGTRWCSSSPSRSGRRPPRRTAAADRLRRRVYAGLRQHGVALRTVGSSDPTTWDHEPGGGS